MKRYSIFISSSKVDLEQEREDLIRAVIELEHMPASMEYFPASNKRSWSYIKRVIDECDYYVLILGARYGSIDPETGLSFTELEFRYARSIGIPTIAFLHNDPEGLPSRYHDNKKMLRSFYAYVKSETLCRFLEDRAELPSMCTTSLVKLIKDFPRPGWIKANSFDGGQHPASQFMKDNIFSLLSNPYREAVEARVDYSETDNSKVLHVIDEVSYKCRAFNGTIDRVITRSSTPGEEEFKSISIKIKKPSGEEKVILQKNSFSDCQFEDGFNFVYEISDEWNIDNLLVVAEAQYLVPVNHFISWEMPVLTNGFALTMTFPRHLQLFHIPYINAYKDNNVTIRSGFFSYKLYTWILPNEGLGWQFYRTSSDNKECAFLET